MYLPQVKVAAVHAAPVYMDAAATLSKALSLMDEAHKNGAELVVFPESFIPGFPVWAALWGPIHNHQWFIRMAENSLLIDGKEIGALRAKAANLGIFVSLGFSERSHVSVGCLWNSSILIDDKGQVLNHHRKLVPTFYEKMVWAPGDGAGLTVSDTRLGRIGSLICGENTNPLARYSLIAQGEQIHISKWPSIWPTKKPAAGGNFDNLAANRIRASAHSFEAKCFGIISASLMDDQMKNMLIDWDSSVADILEQTPQAASMFIDPTGSPIGEMLQHDEGIAYAVFNLADIVEVKQLHDVVGYYNRFDVFDLKVNRHRQSPIAFVDEMNAGRVNPGSPALTNLPFAAVNPSHAADDLGTADALD